MALRDPAFGDAETEFDALDRRLSPRTPVFQIGADIYCDTQLIAAELERLHPQPTLFPDGNPGLGYALGSWARAWPVTAASSMRTPHSSTCNSRTAAHS